MLKFHFLPGQPFPGLDRWCIVASMAAMIAGGCGGQSSSANGSSPTKGGTQSSTIGPLSIMSRGGAKPLVTSSIGSVSTFAQAGSSYTLIAGNPAKNLADTFLLVQRADAGTTEITSLPLTGGTETPLFLGSSTEAWASPTAAQNGVIGLVDETKNTGWSVLPDGSGLKLALGTNLANSLALSPNGSTCVNNWNGTLFVQPYGGTSPGQKIGGNVTWTDSTDLAISPNGRMVAGLGPTNIGNELFVTSTTPGSTATNLQSGSAFISVAWSPDGTTLVATLKSTNGNEILEYDMATGNKLELTPSNYSESFPAFSPDGKKIAFYRDSTGGATPGIYVEDNYGNGAQLLEADVPNTAIQGLVWSWFLPNKTFVGAGGVLGSSASGFIYSQKGDQFASLASFIAKTPTMATITAPSPGNGNGALLYTLSADSITQVDYTNAYIGQTFAVSVNGQTAVVSVDGVTGAVDLVVAAAIPAKVTTKGTNKILEGRFTALYDAHGKNLAPSGSRHVEIDKTGKLISFR